MRNADSKRLLVVALNYAPELTGIGKYVGEMTEWLAAQHVEIRVVTAPPYYPAWSVNPGYSRKWYAKETIAGCEVYRCPIWVPRAPRGLTRILHLLSFAITSFPVMLWQALFWRPDVVFVVEPPICAAPGARLAALLCGARSWLHVQDFEVDAAFELGLLHAPLLRRAVLAAERWLMRRFDHVSNIAHAMGIKLQEKGVNEERIMFFPNWVDTTLIRPTDIDNPLRAELGIGAKTRVVLYSGNMGEKQGLDIILDVARRFTAERDVLFLLCGDGAARSRIDHAAEELSNVRLIPLQPVSRLNELLNLADIHLLPQRAAAEDLVLPSKLGAIMASGRPVVATARGGSDVARAASKGGIVVAPGDVSAFEQAVRRLLRDEALGRRFGASGRAYALQHWERETVLRQTFAQLPGFAASLTSAESQVLSEELVADATLSASRPFAASVALADSGVAFAEPAARRNLRHAKECAVG
jgi:colanic acid biosynthesis glycosyl transferase WcaI